MKTPARPRLRRAVGLLLAATCAAVPSRGSGQTREFTSSNGKKFLAEVAAATPVEVTLLFGPQFGAPRRMPVSSLSEADRSYLEDWRKSRELLMKPPVQLRCWRVRASSDKITDGSVRWLTGYTDENGAFHGGGHGPDPKRDNYLDTNFPGIVNRDTFQLRIGVMQTGEMPAGTAEVEGEVYYDDLLVQMVQRKDVKVALKGLERMKETTFDLIAVPLDRIQFTKDKRGQSYTFAGGNRNKADRLRHLNLRCIVNGRVVGQFVADEVPERR